MNKMLSYIKTRSIFLTSLLVIIMAATYYFWPQGGMPAEVPFVVEVETVAKGRLAKSVKLLAHVKSAQETTFVSHIKGRMKAIYVQEGLPVKKGTLLAELENDEIKNEYAHAGDKVKIAQDQYTRLSQLMKSQAQSQAGLDKAHEVLLRAKIELEQAQDKLNKTQFVAPYDGVCGVFKYRPGETVGDGDVIVSFSNAGSYVLNIDVPESILGEVQPGQSVKYKDWETKVASVQKSLDSESHMGIARAEVSSDWKVSSGQLISVEVEVENKQDVLTLPKEAIFLKGGNSFIYTIADGKANLEAVEIGLQGKYRVEVTEGLKAGDKVILKGQENIWPTRAVKEFHLTEKAKE
jgi:membrane fusion protein (multidrug efflux system)